MLNLESKRDSKPERGWWKHDPAINRKAFGMILHQKEGNWIVARTLIGSPAEKAGVAPGDQFASVDGYELGMGRGEINELYALMLLDDSPSHRVTFRTSAGEVHRDLEKRPLQELLEFDFDNGGANLRGCVGCRTCRPVITGASDCVSGCPGNYCTVG